jgi:hypothetical protein
MRVSTLAVTKFAFILSALVLSRFFCSDSEKIVPKDTLEKLKRRNSTYRKNLERNKMEYDRLKNG